jgi:transcriptional regulator with XRE-family HTH domain
VGETTHPETGGRIKRLREARGLSRRDLAGVLKVDVSSIAGWEAGKRLPRRHHWPAITRTLGADLGALFPQTEAGAPVAAALVDTVGALPGLLVDLTRRTRSQICALRLAAPYVTSAHVQVEWRKLIDQRLRGGTLAVERIEIFYELRRLQETLSNILRYDGRNYWVKTYCVGLKEVPPVFGGYFFDDDEFLLGAYWTGIPPHRRPGLRVSGAPFQRFFREYWDEIWRRGTLLNTQGAHHLGAVRDVALTLGLPKGDWDRFLKEARHLKVGDGAPPLI